MACFRPKADVPSKKVLLLELERAKNGLEVENAALKHKLGDVQSQLVTTAKQRDVLAGQRSELSSQLQARNDQAAKLQAQLALFRTRLQASTQASAQFLSARAEAAAASDLAGRTKSPTKTPRAADVLVLQAECMEGAAGDALGAEAGSVTKPPASPRRQLDAAGDAAAQKQMEVVPVATPAPAVIDGASSESVEDAVAGLAEAQEALLAQVAALQASLELSDEDRAALQADFARTRKRLELAEAAAAEQRRVLQMQCEALQQENSQLTEMSQEVKGQLDTVLSELSAGKKTWNADAAQLAKYLADMEAANARVRAAEAEARSLQAHLAEARQQAQQAAEREAATQEQLASASAELAVASTTLAGREAELGAARAELSKLTGELSHQLQLYQSAAAELRDVRTSEAAAREVLEGCRGQLSTAQRDLAAAQQQLVVQGQALTDAQDQLQESRAALAATGERLTRALADLSGQESRLAEANSQYLSSKQSVITTAKQLATMAKDHSAALARLHELDAEAAGLREQLEEATTAEAAARRAAEESAAAARAAREAADTASSEARRLRAAYDSASLDQRRKIMLLTAIARMANKGQASQAAGSSRSSGGQAAESADGYSAVTSEQRLRLKVCESPLPLLGALTAGIMDSSRLRHLALDLDTSREVTWEKAGLRIVSLAAAIGLNNSLQTLQLAGWTWGEMGNGTALPFLALGGCGGGMLRSVRLATNLFDVESAAMLRDLLAAGLVELATSGEGDDEPAASAPSMAMVAASGSGCQGTLHLYSGNERLDGWYRDMLRLAQRPPATSTATPTSSTATGAAPSQTQTACSTSSFIADVAGAVSASAVPLSVSGDQAAAVECDLSCEALESHHMVLIMAVLLSCPGLRCLRLDGNKLGDGGAALLALGMAGNTGLRELTLSRNSIRAAGARSLARCLDTNSGLRRLDLSGQRLEGLGAAGAEALAQALRLNRTLEELNVSSCGIAGSAAACFAGAIRAAGAMRPRTSLSGGSDALSSSDGLSSSGGGGALQVLSLGSNNIDAPTAKALIVAAAERPALTLNL
ncbi:hypothetical protein HYH02_002457 [Chlamydomonas schloesseri]|uniref:Uncharacterized protein n=1 Tax=Chlamydomonas schloesseri TaxID=2026947 RepID=A0A835WSY0_9CHLO|nr:hypothetical protein HYH02_002457 [Chlamydomonas schloesseri]|eukprot:KAG2453130.1 hypothetical protein HYH02_002457 [Chlamydomonas schloesseri]